MTLRICLLFLLVFKLVSAVFGQTENSPVFDENRKFSRKELIADLDMLKDSLELLHPALYRYLSQNELRSSFKTLAQNLGDHQTIANFFSLLSPVVGSIGDLHTSLELPDEYYQAIGASAKLIPIDIRIINGQVFVASNNSNDTSLVTGSRIISINNIGVGELLRKMESCFSAEGDNRSFKIRRVEQRFAFLFRIIYGNLDFFRIQFEYPDKKGRLTADIEAEPFSIIQERRKISNARYPLLKGLFPQTPFLDFSTDKTGTGILKVSWFQNDVLNENGEQFKPYIDSVFKEIKKLGINNLVIDIRNNGGGESENAALLYSYLTDKPFRFLYAMESTGETYLSDSIEGIKYLPVNAKSRYITADTSAKDNRFFGLGILQPHPDSFKGKICVVMDGLTVSAATQFAGLVKLNKRGKLAGDESPGAINGGSGRGYAYFQLPNTGLLVMISKYRLYMTDPDNQKKEESLKPDFVPKVAMEDLVKGKDSAMELAIQMLVKSN